MVLAGQTFKIADANWTEINYGVEEGAIVIQDDVAIRGNLQRQRRKIRGRLERWHEIHHPGRRNRFAEFSSTAIIDISRKSGIADIEASDNAAPYTSISRVCVTKCRERSLHSKAGQQGKQSPRESKQSSPTGKIPAPRVFLCF